MPPPSPQSETPRRRVASAGGVHALSELLRERLTGEQLSGHERLPDEFTLIRDLGVSRTRLRAALDVLRAEGRLSRRPGHGTFAAAPPLAYQPGPLHGFSSALAVQHLTATHELLSAATWSMDPLSASHFGVAPGVPLHVIERLTCVGGGPMSFGAYVIRGDLAPDMLLDGRGEAGADMRDWLAAASLVPLSHVDVTVEAIAADAATASLLACDIGAPLLRLNRRFMTDSGELLAFGSATNRGDRFTYRAASQPLSSTPTPPAPSTPTDWETAP